MENNLNDCKFLIGNHRGQRKWHIFKKLKEKNCQPRILYAVKIYVSNEGEIKAVSDEGKLKFVASSSALKIIA